MWLHILLSALAFNLAFFFPFYLGCLILFCPIPLFLLLRIASGPWTGFKAGWWWGVCVFGMHFTWMLELLVKHTASSWALCGMIYALVVAYFALSSAVWVAMMVVVVRWISKSLATAASILVQVYVFAISTIMYWIFIEYWIFVPPRLGTGYPFINPCIPLSCFFSLINPCMITMDQPVYVAPVVNRVKNTTCSWRSNPESVGCKLHYQLCKHDGMPAESMYVAPETTFPFPLNHYPHVSNLWSSALSRKSHFFVGSILQEGDKRYQAVFWLQERPIIKVYVKKTLTPFVEKIPPAWKDILPLKEMFLARGSEFCQDREFSDTEFFDVTPRVRIIPRICLEFFLAERTEFERYKNSSKKTVIFVFVNDSWFNNFFREILIRLVVIKAHLIGLPVFYIGHFGCKAVV